MKLSAGVVVAAFLIASLRMNAQSARGSVQTYEDEFIRFSYPADLKLEKFTPPNQAEPNLRVLALEDSGGHGVVAEYIDMPSGTMVAEFHSSYVNRYLDGEIRPMALSVSVAGVERGRHSLGEKATTPFRVNNHPVLNYVTTLCCSGGFLLALKYQGTDSSRRAVETILGSVEWKGPTRPNATSYASESDLSRRATELERKRAEEARKLPERSPLERPQSGCRSAGWWQLLESTYQLRLSEGNRFYVYRGKTQLGSGNFLVNQSVVALTHTTGPLSKRTEKLQFISECKLQDLENGAVYGRR